MQLSVDWLTVLSTAGNNVFTSCRKITGLVVLEGILTKHHNYRAFKFA